MLLYGAQRAARFSPRRLSSSPLQPTQIIRPRAARTTRRASATSAAPPQSLEPRRQRSVRAGLSSQARARSLATAADSISSHRFSETLPFAVDPSWVTPPKNEPSPGMTRLRPYQPPIVVHDSVAMPPPKVTMAKDLGAHPGEVYQNLHACIRVGRLQRAAALVRRLGDYYNSHAPELLDAHNSYLEACVEALPKKHADASWSSIQRWFEVEMRGKGVQPDGKTLSLMIKGVFAVQEEGSRRDRAIRRYLHLANEAGNHIYEEMMASGIYSDEEWDVLVRIEADKFLSPPPREPILSEVQEEASAVPIATMPATAKPDLRPVHLKGMGMTELKHALSTLSDANAIPFPHDVEETQGGRDKYYAYMQQRRLEEDVVDAAIERWREEFKSRQRMELTAPLASSSLGQTMWAWQSTLVPLITKEQEACRKALETPGQRQDEPSRLEYGPFFERLNPEKVAALTLITTINLLGTQGVSEGVKLNVLSSRLGNALELEGSADDGMNRVAASQKKSLKSRQRMALLQKLSRQTTQSQRQRAHRDSERFFREFEKDDWATGAKIKLAAWLISRLIDTATINVTRPNRRTGIPVTANLPAFRHGYQYHLGKRVGLLIPNEAVVEKLTKEPDRGVLGSRLPMVVEPKPWTNERDGGYLRYTTPLVRFKPGDELSKMYISAAIRKGDMDQVLAGLNVLGRTPWRVNRDVFDVVAQAWNTGEGIGSIAPEDPQQELPPEPGRDASPREKFQWHETVRQVENERSGLHSQRCFQNFQLEIARAYLDKVFYYPHSLDFRGRAYPVPPIFNHMGADLSRGLLMFGRGKELGTTGLFWVKVHLANVFGYDKASLKEREVFAMEHIQDVYDSATNPLNGRRWWLSAEDPWQCLATCFELKAALDAPDPTRYVSHLPVHQDGTCNGLQHYAALGGDEIGASQVNLTPGDRPADIYTGVSEIVKAEVAKDAAEGNPFAKVMDGKVTRKVVKQTVMTNVYGVTFIGARDQVLKQLEAIFPHFESTSQVSLKKMAAYIAKKIFKALSEMFTGAHDIQHWLGECGDRICRSLTPEQIEVLRHNAQGKEIKSKYKKFNKRTALEICTNFRSSIIWTTPLKMPVVQPYRITKAREIATTVQSINVSRPHVSDAVDRRKQLQAFPPNFIHSLDATHMLLSALECAEKELTFAAVHDSFWTHACDVPAMSNVLRDAFVRMHSEDIVGRLAEEFNARYKGSMYLASVSRHSDLGERIVRARASLARERSVKLKKVPKVGRYGDVEELLVEQERFRLLHSDDPVERERGAAMVTPCSVFEAAGSEDALESETNATILGEVPASIDKDSQRGGTYRKNEGDKYAPDTLDDAETEDAPAYVRKAASSVKGVTEKVYIWLPISFPPIPKKGSFEVQKLKESRYFFS
ncbi:hypothetical protein BDY21DRAFT_340221 [Lineolata rhizophorae]|uniref:DNA-directed RNA polymerase n=1 Tax=Lineolata rhizophorae TaxID=578093 RepID=A0A6A6P5F7_9PEZI|nr:hypothetical protein BDY21DRAFT_340221 [Lineolata rhizophorae]